MNTRDQITENIISENAVIVLVLSFSIKYYLI